MSFWKTLEKIGLPLVGAVGGDLLGPELGLSPGLGGAIGGALGGGAAGFLTGESTGGTVLNALLGGAGGFGLGEVLGPGAGFGEGGAFAAGGPPAGTSAAGVAGSHADAIGGADSATGGAATDQGGFMDFLKRNPWLLPAGAVGMAALQGNQPIAGEKQLKELAAQAAGVGKLSNTLQTGQLPPGAEGLVQNALNDTIAGIRSNYANMGLSGSSMEAQDIAAAQSRAAAQRFQLASAITTQGLDAAGLSANIYAQIAQLQLGQDSELSNALAALSQSGGYFGGLKSVA